MNNPTKVLDLDRESWVMAANIAVKIGLVVVFFIAIVFEPPGVVGKGMLFRAPIFLGPAVVIPIIAKVRGWDPYPHAADALLSAPFFLDTLANVLGFYESFLLTDDVLHLTNWVLLVSAIAAFRFRNVFDGTGWIALGYGLGGLLIIWWEIAEWFISTEGPFLGGEGLELGYSDTVGDLFLSSTGGLIGAVVALKLLGPKAKVEERIATPP